MDFVELVGMMHRLGVQVVTGTDCGVRPENVPYPVPLPGVDLHEEMKLFVDAGFTPLQALQSATSVPARVLRVDDQERDAGRSQGFCRDHERGAHVEGACRNERLVTIVAVHAAAAGRTRGGTHEQRNFK